MSDRTPSGFDMKLILAQLERIEDKVDKLDEKVDGIDRRVDSVDITLTRQHGSLEDHTRRSLANEKAVEILKDEIKPIVTHVHVVGLVSKWVAAGIGAVVGSGFIWELVKLAISKSVSP